MGYCIINAQLQGLRANKDTLQYSLPEHSIEGLILILCLSFKTPQKTDFTQSSKNWFQFSNGI